MRAAAALLALLLAGCHQVEMKTAPTTMSPPPAPTTLPTSSVASSSDLRSEYGPVLLVVRKGDLYVDAVNVIVDNRSDWDEIRGVVNALYGGDVNVPSVQTVDAYVQGLLAAEKKRPSGSKLDIGKIRSDIQNDLHGHKAVVYRYVSVPKTQP